MPEVKDSIVSDKEKQVAELEATQKEIQGKQVVLEKTKADVTDYETRKAALDLELQRVQKDISDAKEERRKVDVKDQTFQEKLRGENLESAQTKFFSQFEYKPEERVKFLEAFKSFDSQVVSSDLIFNDLLRTRVSMDPNKYIKLEEELQNLRKRAAEFNQDNSSSGFPGGDRSNSQTTELTEDEIRAANWAKIPIERYKEMKAKGLLD